jgi:phage terminase large subunit-like protein
MLTEKELVKQAAETDLLTFIRLIAPHRMLGAVHEELCSWWNREDAKDNQLVLLPRDHQKSAMIAYRVAWWITKYPETTVLYVSATANLAEKQLKAVKDILLSDIYRFYWPEMVNEMEGKRERWSVDEISVDHPKRKAEGIRDATIKAAGITANVTGLHCNVAVLDDVVVPDNAYSQLGRDQVRAFYSQLSSIESTGAKEWAVGTRYHPADLYRDMMEMTEIYFEDNADEETELEVYETYERTVETNGEFLWPKQRRTDGKTFGFDARELARKKAKYLDVTQFYAQYYNNPNAVETQLIDRSRFSYYERNKVENVSGAWYMGDKLLHIYAAMDFAYTINANSDYTVIAVIGVDEDNNYYVLDIDRFKTNKISVMYEKAETVFRKWRFKKMRCEVVAAQRLIVGQFKDYMRSQNIVFTIDEYNPPRNMSKAERIATILEPRYNNNQIWHYKGGNCQILEEELIMNNPEHDDVKDAVAACVEICKAPMGYKSWNKRSNVVQFNSKFGGVAY